MLDWNKYWINDFLSPLKPHRDKISKNRLQCINFIFEDGGESLKSLQLKNSLSLTTFRQILFQVIYTLYEAQKQCQFVHNDLHPGNILVKFSQSEDLDNSYRTYKNPKKTQNNWRIHKNIHVKLIDFGLSRVTLDNGTDIYNPKVCINLEYIY